MGASYPTLATRSSSRRGCAGWLLLQATLCALSFCSLELRWMERYNRKLRLHMRLPLTLQCFTPLPPPIHCGRRRGGTTAAGSSATTKSCGRQERRRSSGASATLWSAPTARTHGE